MPEAPLRRAPGGEQSRRTAGVERGSDRLVSILLSVMVHAVIVGALVWGWWRYRTPPAPPPSLAIQAHVVRDSAQPRSGIPPVEPPADETRIEQARQAAQLKAAAAAAAQVAQAAAAKAAAQKAADAEAAAQAATQQAAEHAAAEHAAAERAAAAKVAQEQAQRDADAAAAKAAAVKEAEAQAKLEAERKAKAKAEEKARAEAAREAQQVAQQLKAEQAERQREADLRTQVQAEQRLDALERGPAEAEYRSLIEAKISRAWIRPASAQAGVQCTIHLTQIPGGDVTHVVVEGCNGDEAVIQSVQNAAYRASPLPTPPDPALFDPNITVTFAPDQ